MSEKSSPDDPRQFTEWLKGKRKASHRDADKRFTSLAWDEAIYSGAVRVEYEVPPYGSNMERFFYYIKDYEMKS